MSQESRAKRFKPNQLASGLKPELQFKELEIAQVPWTCIDSDKFSAHIDSAHNLYVSDTNKIVCFRRDGSCRHVVSGLEPHHIVPNSTADYVVILRKSDKQKLCKVFADGSVNTILETVTPLYGPDVCPNGDIVHHPSTSRLERRSSNGDLLATIEGSRGKVISFEANSYLTSGQDGHVYFSSKTCVYRWNHQERTVECIAGHPKSAGRRDGFGTDARFTHLKRPVLTRNFAYVRESDNRFCRIDLTTYEVATLQMRGIEHGSIETYGVTPDGRIMFLICTVPFRIFTAETVDTLESTFFADMRRVQWLNKAASGSRVTVEFIAGRNKERIVADKRILEARSTYFRSMFSGGMREACADTGPIDLGDDVNAEAMEALLHFLHTDTFEPVTPPSHVMDMRDEEVLRHSNFALEVHTLADRFLLPRLARLCEVFLSDFALRSSLVLPLLANITSPRRPSLANLEAACWSFLEDNWAFVKHSQQSIVDELVATGHPLASELIGAAVGLKRKEKEDDKEEPTLM
mmetsp:Transcript_136209/g.236820  ORF Transcript_136209/g.236820 Transcript_136209/m.236820 type:complete len:520 (-) Transcript_136209:96-1655(-)